TVQESDIDIEELQAKLAAVTLELKNTKLELQNTKSALANSERARQAANLDRVHPRPRVQQEEVFCCLARRGLERQVFTAEALGKQSTLPESAF
ncbi:hypothetical protein BGZ80_010445, partial [Entomortierella chlamydospora]